MMVYGFIASVLPVWVLLAPRDYLSAFMKIGTIMSCSRSAFVMPPLKMPAEITSSALHGWSGVRRGSCSRSVHHDRARCGVGLHALGQSGTTPKMLSCEPMLVSSATAAC